MFLRPADENHLPNNSEPCYDCGSTIPCHHTAICATCYDDDVKDLPAVPGTQYWAATRDAAGKRVAPADRPSSL